MRKFIFALAITTVLFLQQRAYCKPPSIIDNALQSVVMIMAFDRNHQLISMGSGFVVSQGGVIATNYHVIEDASSALVKLIGKEQSYQVVKIIHRNPSFDIAVLQVEKGFVARPLELGDDQIVNVGDRILAVGNPQGLEGTVSEGIISGFRKLQDDFRLIQITAPISPGSSGGPVINQEGQALGIASASLVKGQNLNFAVPVTALKQVLRGKKKI